ncbi:MAG: NADH-quinone oxidoreductase subunit N [Acidobacteriota bacterium]
MAFDITTIVPELFLTGWAFLLLFLSLVPGNRTGRLVGIFGLVGIAGTLVLLVMVSASTGAMSAPGGVESFGGMFVLDGFALFFKWIFLLSALFTILLSFRYLVIEKVQGGEFYSLVLFSVVGMMFMASGRDLVVIFIGMETMSISLYVLAGYLKTNRKSNEAALKYFLLGSFSTGLFLYGVSLVYATCGTTNLAGIAARIQAGTDQSLLLLGVILLMVAFAFKVAAVPFHMWAPDAYEGAPTPITAFLSTGSKAAAFVIFTRIFLVGFLDLRDSWMQLLAVLAVASMTLGNVTALLQENMKRMLAYSSIAHAGYLLMGFLAAGRIDIPGAAPFAVQAVLLYLLVYTFMNLGVFGVVVMLRREGVIGDQVSDFSGLAQRMPVTAFTMMIFLLSLAGIPLTAGFIGKWYLFGAAIRSEYAWLAVVAVLNAAVSLYYYLRVVVYMYMGEARDQQPLATSPALTAALVGCAVFTLWFGIFPQRLLELAKGSILFFGR